ncbi:hypothetical protein [Rhizobium leguminosarum]|uniref:hypothetical protein n=1 Tax=Rhizobium leguminosarum TaxID=384 RepID=UPI003AF13CF9
MSDPVNARNQQAQEEAQRRSRRGAAGEQASRGPAFAPANDASRNTPASILKSFDGASSRSAVRTATLFSVLWVMAGLGLMSLLYAPQIWQIRSLADLVALPGVIAGLVGIIIPVMMFYAFAIMISRAQDMRNAARSMAEVALRLAEPETIASERIMTVGQAVRREVSAMNEGIERTIARASELETLVHSEVNALERSYADNELRVRGLVHELGSEREAIVNHADRIRTSIGSVHDQLKEELSLATEEIAVRLATSGEAFASLIDTRAATILEKSDSALQSMGSLLAAKTDTLLQTLNASGFALATEFDNRLEALSVNLNDHGERLLSQFETRASTMDSSTEKLNAALNERTHQLNEILIARTREINESLTSGERTIGGTLDDVLSKLNNALDEKGASFRQSLQTTADDAVMDLDVRSGFFEERLQTTVAQLSTAFDERVSEFTSAFDKRTGSLDTKLMESLARINETLTGGSDLDRRHPEFRHRPPWFVDDRPVAGARHRARHRPRSAGKHAR